MNASLKHLKVNKDDIPVYLLGITTSFLLLGYAYSSIALGAFITYTFFFYFKNLKKPTFTLQLFLPVLLYLYLALTYFWSMDKALTLTGAFRLLSLLLVPIAFSIMPKISVRQLKIILKFFTTANVVLAVFFIVSASIRYFETKDIQQFTYHNLVQDLDLNAVYVSAYFALSFFYVISGRQKKIMHLFLALFLLVMILLLSSKTIIFITITGIVVYLMKFIKNPVSFFKKKWSIILLGLLAVFILSKPIINRIIAESKTNFEEVVNNEKFNKVYPWTGTSFRMLQLRILKEQIREERIFFSGFGLFASRDNLKERHIALNTYPGYHTYNYHNLYAQVLAESGVIGLLLLLTLIFFLLYKASKTKSFIFFMFGILMTIWFFSESVLWVQRGVLFFIIFYCAFVNASFKELK